MRLLTFALLLVCVPAFAESPSGAETSTATTTETSSVSGSRLEPGFLPAINFDSNLGFGFGAIANIAKVNEEVNPYEWRIQAQVFASAKGKPGGGVEIPFQSHYVIADVPQLGWDALRIIFNASFQRQINAGYYGLGNASRDEDPEDQFDPDSEEFAAAARFNQYDRIYPTLSANARIDLFDAFDLFAGASLQWNFFNLYPGSKLVQDLADPSLSNVLSGAQRHGTLQLTAGLLYDTRNNEITPSTGGFHEISFRGAKLVELDNGFGGVNVTLRQFFDVADPYLVVATRLMADILVGRPPFYELAQHAGFFPHEAIAGNRAIRGPPGMRYHGKVKVLGNLELRSKLIPFTMFGLESNLGLIGFFDVGRVWADLESRPELDGTDIRLKYGVGGGLRFQWGETFIIRADTGWSPDGLAIFINVNHIF